MKNKLLVVAAVFGLLFSINPGTAMAQVDDLLVAKIPFPFRVGSVSFAPGRYTIQTLDDTQRWMQIRSNDTGRSTYFQVTGTEVRVTPQADELVFTRVGSHYALAKLLEEGSNIADTVIRFHRETRLSALAPSSSSGTGR